MLYNDHCKAAKELQRKIEKLKMEGKDPALPQKLDATTSAKSSTPRSNSKPYVGPSRVNTSSPQPVMPMSDSQNAGEESFMLLGGQRVRLSNPRASDLLTIHILYFTCVCSRIQEMLLTSSGTLCKGCWITSHSPSHSPPYLSEIQNRLIPPHQMISVNTASKTRAQTRGKETAV